MTTEPRLLSEREGGYRVTVQHGTYGRDTSWAYALHFPDEYPFVSAARWATPEAALAAGEKDLDATLAYHREHTQEES